MVKKQIMKIKSAILSLITLAILASCSTSNNVVGGGIQKRKYNDGFYVSGGKIFDRKMDERSIENVLAEEKIVETELTSEESEELISVNSELIEQTETAALLQIETETQVTDAEMEPLTVQTNSIVEEQENGLKSGSHFKTLSKKLKIARSNISKNAPAEGNSSADTMLILLIILAFFLPWLSVGIYTNWDIKLTLITLLLWFLFVLPGVIFAILVLLGFI